MPSGMGLSTVKKMKQEIDSKCTIVKSKSKDYGSIAKYEKAGDAFAVNDSRAIDPPYDISRLAELSEENDTLSQCINAMEVNIDGTGFYMSYNGGEDLPAEEISSRASDLKREIESLSDISHISMRRKLRFDLETVGYGLLEVSRSIDGRISFINRVKSYKYKMLPLGDPLEVEVTIFRDGDYRQVKTKKYFRRFVRTVGGKTLYFAEFGAPQYLNKHTGNWGRKLNSQNRATELIYFGTRESYNSPYHVPRWIHQLPSVLGGRKAEIENLEFFDNGGVPPVMITVEGGILGSEVRKTLESYFSGSQKNRNRAAIVEVAATGGSIDHPATVRVKVEKFGNSQTKDAMFLKYMERCQKAVQHAFRLPDIFLGISKDYNRATAIASYLVAEAQIFRPERIEFDAIINKTIMQELSPDFDYVSKPLTITDIENKLKALELAGDRITDQSYIDTLNNLTDVDLQLKEELQTLVKSMGSTTYDLAKEWVSGFLGDGIPSDIVKQVSALPEDERTIFDNYVTLECMSGIDYDPDGITEVTTAAIDVLGCECGDH